MKRPLSLKKKPARQRPPGKSFTGRILNTIYEDDTPNRSMKDDTSKTMNYHDDDDGDVGEGAFDNHNATMRIVRLDNNEHENIGAGGDNNPSSYQREHQVRSIFSFFSRERRIVEADHRGGDIGGEDLEAANTTTSISLWGEGDQRQSVPTIAATTAATTTLQSPPSSQDDSRETSTSFVQQILILCKRHIVVGGCCILVLIVVVIFAFSDLSFSDSNSTLSSIEEADDDRFTSYYVPPSPSPVFSLSDDEEFQKVEEFRIAASYGIVLPSNAMFEDSNDGEDLKGDYATAMIVSESQIQSDLIESMDTLALQVLAYTTQHETTTTTTTPDNTPDTSSITRGTSNINTRNNIFATTSSATSGFDSYDFSSHRRQRNLEVASSTTTHITLRLPTFIEEFNTDIPCPTNIFVSIDNRCVHVTASIVAVVVQNDANSDYGNNSDIQIQRQKEKFQNELNSAIANGRLRMEFRKLQKDYSIETFGIGNHAPINSSPAPAISATIIPITGSPTLIDTTLFPSHAPTSHNGTMNHLPTSPPTTSTPTVGPLSPPSSPGSDSVHLDIRGEDNTPSPTDAPIESYSPSYDPSMSVAPSTIGNMDPSFSLYPSSSSQPSRWPSGLPGALPSVSAYPSQSSYPSKYPSQSSYPSDWPSLIPSGVPSFDWMTPSRSAAMNEPTVSSAPTDKARVHPRPPISETPTVQFG